MYAGSFAGLVRRWPAGRDRLAPAFSRRGVQGYTDCVIQKRVSFDCIVDVINYFSNSIISPKSSETFVDGPRWRTSMEEMEPNFEVESSRWRTSMPTRRLHSWMTRLLILKATKLTFPGIYRGSWH
jgi:hypothetical protein